MMLTFAFLVDRGSWSRSWLPERPASGPDSLFPSQVRAPPKMHPNNFLTSLTSHFFLVLPRRWLHVLLLLCLSNVQQIRCTPLFPDGGRVA